MAHERHYVPHEPEAPDAWHAHSTAEGDPQVEHGGKPNYLLIGVVLVASVAVVFGTVIATIMYFRKHSTELRRERVESPTALRGEYADYRTASDKVITQYRFSDEAAARAGRVVVPLDDAKRAVVERYQQKSKPRAEVLPSGNGG